MKTLTGFIIEVGDIGRFDDPRQIQKLAGLAIVKNESGKHEGESYVSYRGRKHLRYTLYEAAVSVVAFKLIHHRYTKREQNPLKKMQSLIAIACKLMRLFHMLLTTGREYNTSKMMGDIKQPELKAA